MKKNDSGVSLNAVPAFSLFAFIAAETVELFIKMLGFQVQVQCCQSSDLACKHLPHLKLGVGSLLPSYKQPAKSRTAQMPVNAS